MVQNCSFPGLFLDLQRHCAMNLGSLTDLKINRLETTTMYFKHAFLGFRVMTGGNLSIIYFANAMHHLVKSNI